MTDEEFLAEAVANASDQYKINEVTKLQAVGEKGCLHVFLNLSVLKYGRAIETFDAMHVYRTSDPHGLSPLVAQWLLDNPEFPITPEEKS